MNQLTYFENSQLCVQVGSQLPLADSLLALAGRQQLIDNLVPQPRPQAILEALEAAYAQGYEKAASNEFELQGIALAGSGDPLLHLNTVEAFLPIFKQQRHGVPVTLVTFGLVPSAEASAVCQQLLEVGVEKLHVFLPASNPMDYHARVGASPAQFGHLCGFIQTASETEMDVRTFAYAPTTARSELSALSQSLGARGFEIKNTG